MILRRITANFRKQDWTAVTVELVIVVLGVFIGLQAQEWSKRQQDRQSETQIVADLLADLDLDRSKFAFGLAADEREISAANASFTGAGLPPIEFDQNIPPAGIESYSLDLSKIADVPEDRRDMLWTDVVVGYFPTPSTVTYDAMIGAGDFKIVQDREIVRDIQTYHSLTGTVTQQNQKLLSIRANTLDSGAAYGLAPYLRMPAEDYFRLVASKPQLAAAIRIQATFAIYHHGEIESADARAARLQVHLKSYLKAEK